MSATALVLALAVALILIAVALNHFQARLALVELALNEGLPPGYQRTALAATSTLDVASVASALGPGIHVFLSRNCHACQRLIDELEESQLVLDANLHFRYVDRARPIAHDAADRHGATLTEHQVELSAQVQADPLPFTISVGEHALVARAVTPTVDQVIATARDAGIAATRTVARTGNL